MKALRVCLATALAVIGVFAAAPSASADHHFMSIREFFPGTVANVDRKDAFVELQMYAAGQSITAGHHIDLYGPMGDATPATHTLAMTNPPNSQNQRTILIGGVDVTGRDYAEDIGPNSDPTGGAICFRSQTLGVIDCVEWGTGNTVVNAGAPALPGGIPDEKSITRSIGLGCPTLLEPGDDTNDSATDFLETSPSPRANAGMITETPCPTLNVLLGGGVGNGMVIGGGINCPGVCSKQFATNTMVSLTATPLGSATFASWANCPTPNGVTCDLTMDMSRTVTANFNPPPGTGGGGGTTTPTVTGQRAAALKKCKKKKTAKARNKCRKRANLLPL